MMRTTFSTVLALSTLAACVPSRATPAAAPSSGAQPSVAAPSRSGELVAKPSGDAAPIRSDELVVETSEPVVVTVEQALDLAVEPSALTARRALPLGSAKLIEPGTREVWSRGELDLSFSTGIVVLDDTRSDRARRLTLLCEGHNARVVAEIDARGLQPVTAKSAFVRPEHESQGADSLVPGLRLRAGEVLELRGEGKDGTLRVHYEVPPLEVTGLVAKELVDVAFTADAALPATGAAGTMSALRESDDLLDAPSGRAFGRILVDASDGDVAPGEPVLVVERRAGYALVVLSTSVAHAIGWVSETKLKDGPASGSGDVWGGMIPRSETTVRLAKGTSLLGPKRRHAVGIVKSDGEFGCVDDCAGPNPLVEVYACGTNLTARVDVPRGARRKSASRK